MTFRFSALTGKIADMLSGKVTKEFIPVKRPKELLQMRDSGRLVAEAFALLGENIKPGVALCELDLLVEKFLDRHGAKPLYKGYRGNPADHPPFPGVICASINEEVCHGLPNERILKEGDIVGIDIGVLYRGYCGDACVTYPVGRISAEAQRLLDVAQECLRLGIEKATPRYYLNEIGAAIHNYADRQGVSVVREWGGHGLGRTLHQAPSVSHVRLDDRGPRLQPGNVFTIEPMINLGTHEWKQLDDGWTVVTTDGRLSAQFEHTVAITDNGPEILTLL